MTHAHQLKNVQAWTDSGDVSLRVRAVRQCVGCNLNHRVFALCCRCHCRVRYEALSDAKQLLKQFPDAAWTNRLAHLIRLLTTSIELHSPAMQSFWMANAQRCRDTDCRADASVRLTYAASCFEADHDIVQFLNAAQPSRGRSRQRIECAAVTIDTDCVSAVLGNPKISSVCHPGCCLFELCRFAIFAGAVL